MIKYLHEINRYADDYALQYQVGNKQVEQITRTTNGFMIVYPDKMRFIPLHNIDCVECDDATDIMEYPVADLKKQIEQLNARLQKLEGK